MHDGAADDPSPPTDPQGALASEYRRLATLMALLVVAAALTLPGWLLLLSEGPMVTAPSIRLRLGAVWFQMAVFTVLWGMVGLSVYRIGRAAATRTDPAGLLVRSGVRSMFLGAALTLPDFALTLVSGVAILDIIGPNPQPWSLDMLILLSGLEGPMILLESIAAVAIAVGAQRLLSASATAVGHRRDLFYWAALLGVSFSVGSRAMVYASNSAYASGESGLIVDVAGIVALVCVVLATLVYRSQLQVASRSVTPPPPSPAAGPSLPTDPPVAPPPPSV